MRQLLKQLNEQSWFTAQNMEPKEREAVIKWIISLTKTKGSFIDYSAKYFMACLIDYSEPKYNGSGKMTRVKQFEYLGWYDKNNKLIFSKIMEG